MRARGHTATAFLHIVLSISDLPLRSLSSNNRWLFPSHRDRVGAAGARKGVRTEAKGSCQREARDPLGPFLLGRHFEIRNLPPPHPSSPPTPLGFTPDSPLRCGSPAPRAPSTDTRPPLAPYPGPWVWGSGFPGTPWRALRRLPGVTWNNPEPALMG